MMMGNDFYKKTTETLGAINTNESTDEVIDTTSRIPKDGKQMKGLIERALCIFESKLVNCGYTTEEVEKILNLTRKNISAEIKKLGFSIVWTINLAGNKNEKIRRTLLDDFRDLNIKISPLGHYEMIIDYWRNEISVSDIQGHRPQLV